VAVQKDPNTGKYYFRFTHNGKPFRRVIGTDKRAAELTESELKKELVLADLENRGYDTIKQLRRAHQARTFTEAAEDYMAERANYKQSTLSAYRSILDTYLLKRFGSMPLSSITPSDLRKFQVTLSEHTTRKGQPTSARRVNNIMQLLRSIIGQEYKAGELDRNPTLNVRRMQEDKADIDPLSTEELELALSCVDAFYKPLFTVLAFTGARPNELMALRWSDIDWQSETISINKGRVRGVEGKPKTKSSERLIPMTARVKEALEALQKKAVTTLDPLAAIEQDYVFKSKKSEPINKHLDRIWATGLRKAKLRHRPSYQLRHTFATHCIERGLSLKYIADTLGHTTIDTLVRNYSGSITADKKQNDAKLKAAFQPEVVRDLVSANDLNFENFSPSGFEEIWGRRGDLNPRIPGPQPGALTTWRRLPYCDRTAEDLY